MNPKERKRLINPNGASTTNNGPTVENMRSALPLLTYPLRKPDDTPTRKPKRTICKKTKEMQLFRVMFHFSCSMQSHESETARLHIWGLSGNLASELAQGLSRRTMPA